MKRNILVLVAATALVGAVLPAAKAAETKAAPVAVKHDDAMCETHCNLMELQKKVDGLKAQQNSGEKATMKAHLKADIAQYEKKLEELKAKLEAM